LFIKFLCAITLCYFFFQAEDGIRDFHVTGVQTCALPISADGLCRLRLYVEAGEVERLKATYRSLVARFSSEFSPRGEPTIDVDPVTNDWETKWSEGLVAVELIPGLVLVPEGASYESSPGETAMLVEKGLVFGFGEHPTTQMASRWLASEVAGKTLLDIGTGTGVLALVAAHCGARTIRGVDI